MYSIVVRKEVPLITHTEMLRGSGGILLHIKEGIHNDVVIMNDMYADDRIWIKLFALTKYEDWNDIYCCFCYMLPSDSMATVCESSQRHVFEAEIMKYLIKGSILLCGDLNARTGNIADYIKYDSPVTPTCIDYVVDMEEPRVSTDMSVNTRRKNLFDLCISSRLRIVNGRHAGDKEGGYTCYTP